MKSISLSFIAIFISLCGFGQQTNSILINPSYLEANQTNQVHTSEYPPLSSGIVLRKTYANDGVVKEDIVKYEGEHAADKCSSYHKMKIAGIVLSAVGGAMIISGAIIRGAAYRSSTDGTINNYDYNNAMIGGGAMIGTGALCVGAGIPLAIIGSVKGHKYCYGGGSAPRDRSGY